MTGRADVRIAAVLWSMLALAALSHAQNAQEAPDRAELATRVELLTRQVAELTRMVEVLMKRTAGPGNDAGTGAQAKPQPAAAAADQAKPVAESAVKALGPLRFGGDFRLRLDGIFRPAYNSRNPEDASLPHVQNIRGRYRLRLNLNADLHPAVSFHGQLATGPVNNPLTLDQDFAGVAARQPILINEAWIDFHPRKWFTIQGGRLQEVFADNLRFLFDDDITFNGFNERMVHEFKKPVMGVRRFEVRAGQYIFTNPGIAIVTPANLGATGAVLGTTGRAAQMFHQGFLLEQGLSAKVSQVFGTDVQVYRNPNQIQFASTTAGVPVLVQNALGLALSGPIAGTGNATTTAGGAIYAARNFQVARLSYRLDYSGFKSERQDYPVALNVQAARNTGTGQHERDALLAALKIGRIQGRWDHSFLYLFAVKGANSMISQLTDDDLGTASGVNIRSHFLRFDLGLAKNIQLQNLFFIQNELRRSGQYPNFFVPLGSFAPRQYRFQEQILFVF